MAADSKKPVLKSLKFGDEILEFDRLVKPEAHKSSYQLEIALPKPNVLSEEIGNKALKDHKSLKT